MRDTDARPGLNTLMPEVYDQLRAVAHKLLNQNGAVAGPTLQATAVVHEVWVRLHDYYARPNDRAHLLALASRVIREVVIDHVRARGRVKRGGGRRRIPLDDALVIAEARSIDLIALDEALEELAKFGPRQAAIVEMRFFGGLSHGEIAEALGVSRRTVENDWLTTRAWLASQLE